TLSYALYPKVILLSSAERGVRLPSENEVFGDAGDNISENPNIRPETSKNFNLGFRLGDYDYKRHRFGFNINGFYRNITGRIGTPVQAALYSEVQTLRYANPGNVTSDGIDFEFPFSYNNNEKLIFNTSKLALTTKDGYGKEKKIPNEPSLTANASVQ